MNEYDDKNLSLKTRRWRDAASIIVTAVEGGINYWAEIDKYDWYDPNLTRDAESRLSPGPEGVSNAVATVTERDGDAINVTIDPESIIQALVKIVTDPDKITYLSRDALASAGLILAGRGRDADVDATIADQIVQVAVLGEVIYG